MTRLSPTNISCGVYQLEDLAAKPADLLMQVMAGYKWQARSQGRKNGFAQIIFSDNMSHARILWTGNTSRPHFFGQEFADYLIATFPTSSISELLAKRSPCSGNNIKTWVWNIPHVAFKRHAFYANVDPRRIYRDDDY